VSNSVLAYRLAVLRSPLGLSSTFVSSISTSPVCMLTRRFLRSAAVVAPIAPLPSAFEEEDDEEAPTALARLLSETHG